MDLTAKVLRALLAADRPVSGQELAEAAGVSRTAVWKAVARLRKENAPIAAEKGRGYWLEGDPPLTADLVSARLTTQRLGRPVHYFEQTDSTNLRAKELAATGAADGTLVLADSQTSGRGRLDRAWASPPGANLLLSIILRPNLALGSFFRLTMAAAVALARAVEELTDLAPLIKWPNDLYLDEAKLAGILTEISGQAEGLDWAVVGVGVNVNAAPELKTGDYRAASLADLTGRRVDRLELLNLFLLRLEEMVEAGLPPQELRQHWLARSMTIGRRVTVADRGRNVTGLAQDIDGDGALILETDDGLVRVVSGDVGPG